MRVGIPRCLSFYYLFPLYRTFLEELGIPFVETGSSTLRDLQELVLCPTDEPCVSVKIAFPHAANLIKRGCDVLFVPTIVSLEQDSFCCPKMMGLPSMLKSGLGLSDSQVISPSIDVRDNPRRWKNTWIEAGRQLGVDDPKRVELAFDTAWNSWKETESTMVQYSVPLGRMMDGQWKDRFTYRNAARANSDVGCENDRMLSREPVTAVMGHAYILNDIFGQVILKYTSQHGPLILPEMVSKKHAKQALGTIFEGQRMWTIEGHILGSCLHLIRTRKVDRIILVTSFSCGPLSIIENYIEKEADEHGIPLLYLAVDEHTGEAGLITRMEAFMDACVSRQKESVHFGSDQSNHEVDISTARQITEQGPIGVVNMGHLNIAVGTVFEKLGIEAKIAGPLSDAIVELGRELAPEFICYPMVTLLGQIRSMIDQGVSRVVMIQGKGKCRLGWYAQIMETILNRAGYKVRIYAIDSPFPLKEKGKALLEQVKEIFGSPKASLVAETIILALRKMFCADAANDILLQVRAKERVRGSGDRIYNKFVPKLDNVTDARGLRAVFKEYKREMMAIPIIDEDPLKIMIVGEIYVINEPFVTKDVEKMLGSMEQRIRVYKNLDVSSWVKTHLLMSPKAIFEHKRVVRAANRYLPVSVGGHGQESIGETVLAKKAGMDGVIHLFPFTCMPEIIAQSVLVQISEDLDLPILSLMLSEQTGVAGLKTRLEAFCDVLYGRSKNLPLPRFAM